MRNATGPKKKDVVRLVTVLNVLVTGLLLSSAGICAEHNGPQPSAEKNAPDVVSSDQVESRLAEIRKVIKAAEAAENEQTASQLGTTLTDLKERNALLRRRSAVYMRLLTSMKKQSSLQKEAENLSRAAETEKESLITEPPPYTLTVYDRYLDQLSEATHKKESAKTLANFYKRRVEESQTEVDKAQKKLRLLKEDVESYGTREVPNSLQWNYEFANVQRELAQAMLELARLDYDNTITEQRLAGLRIDIARSQVQWIKERLTFDQDDLNKRLESVDERRQALEERISALKKEKLSVDEKWVEAQEAFDEAQEAEQLVKEQAEAYLKAREAWRDTYQRVLDQSEIQMQILSLQKQLWQQRYSLLRDYAGEAELNSWRKEANTFIEKVERGLEVMQDFQTTSQSQIASLKSRLSDETLNPVVRDHMENRLKALQKSTERDLEFISAALGIRELEQRLIDEINEKQKTISVTEKIEGLGDRIRSLWEFELWVIDDRAVTVRKVVVVLVIVIIGMILARLVTRFFGKRLATAPRLDQTAAAAIEKVLYYFALLILLLIALRIVNIPLTVFTVFGGAIAIGVGFGAQNLLNNFISGFILMIERPVKIGDLIEVENNYGIIEEIGTRCTQIRTAGNIHILVPNSSFLEKNIINWTLADQKIRTHIAVGVVYGSDTRRVKQLLLEATREHGKVLKSPEPFVLFNEFGDNALLFEIYFWIRIQRLMDRRIIESDIRYIIDELFRETGITIAFPQRDVHLDTKEPISLKIINDQDPAKSSE